MAPPSQIYDTIGLTYASTRVEDPRVAAQVHAALGDAATIVNVGAGTGNYEPADRTVVAVEPSQAMLRQRSGRSPRVVRAEAERLPFPDDAFDAAMAVLTVHHWRDRATGLAELARVSRRQVIFFYEPLRTHAFWVLDYFPEARALPFELDPPGEADIAAALQLREVQPVLVPFDCTDGFGAAFWRRPEAYAQPNVQAGMSFLASLPTEVLQRGSQRLLDDLAAGAWDERYGHLRHESSFDAGYRIAICGGAP